MGTTTSSAICGEISAETFEDCRQGAKETRDKKSIVTITEVANHEEKYKDIVETVVNKQFRPILGSVGGIHVYDDSEKKTVTHLFPRPLIFLEENGTERTLVLSVVKYEEFDMMAKKPIKREMRSEHLQVDVYDKGYRAGQSIDNPYRPDAVFYAEIITLVPTDNSLGYEGGR
jgi:hypothetical protein